MKRCVLIARVYVYILNNFTAILYLLSPYMLRKLKDIFGKIIQTISYTYYFRLLMELCTELQQYNLSKIHPLHNFKEFNYHQSY